MTSRCYIICA
jgi:hypothetical protein